MFHAMILVCLAANISNCLIAEDELGPYKTEAECMDRIGKMSIAVMDDGFVPVKYHCQKITGELTSYEPISSHTGKIIKVTS